MVLRAESLVKKPLSSSRTSSRFAKLDTIHKEVELSDKCVSRNFYFHHPKGRKMVPGAVLCKPFSTPNSARNEWARNNVRQSRQSKPASGGKPLRGTAWRMRGDLRDVARLFPFDRYIHQCRGKDMTSCQHTHKAENERHFCLCSSAGN